MCNSCGYSICNCVMPIFNQNWFSTQTCVTCTPTEVCKKQIPAKCVIYKGSNLANLGLTSNIDVQQILTSVDTILGSMHSNLVIALNSINARLNALETATHANYTI